MIWSLTNIKRYSLLAKISLLLMFIESILSDTYLYIEGFHYRKRKCRMYHLLRTHQKDDSAALPAANCESAKIISAVQLCRASFSCRSPRHWGRDSICCHRRKRKELYCYGSCLIRSFSRNKEKSRRYY